LGKRKTRVTVPTAVKVPNALRETGDSDKGLKQTLHTVNSRAYKRAKKIASDLGASPRSACAKGQEAGRIARVEWRLKNN